MRWSGSLDTGAFPEKLTCLTKLISGATMRRLALPHGSGIKPARPSHFLAMIFVRRERTARCPARRRQRPSASGTPNPTKLTGGRPVFLAEAAHAHGRA